MFFQGTGIMEKGRLEAFSDGVIAVIITIMVLELKVPQHGTDIAALLPLLPVFLSYVLSFIYVGIYWNNHHHLFFTAKKISGRVMWANLHFLFWLSLFPFVTGWMSENHHDPLPTALYGFVLFMAALAWPILLRQLIAANGSESKLAQAVGNDLKGKISLLGYALGIGLAFVHPWMADALYAVVAMIWLVPDTRIEKGVSE